MAEVDALVLSYLASVSDKLAKQFAKKRPSAVPWTGPELNELINFYRKHCKGDNPAPEAAAEEASEQNNGEEKRGKKRKLSEMKEDPGIDDLKSGTAKSKKKGKKSKKGIKELSEKEAEAVKAIVDDIDPNKRDKKKKKKKKVVSESSENGHLSSPVEVVEVIQDTDDKAAAVETLAQTEESVDSDGRIDAKVEDNGKEDSNGLAGGLMEGEENGKEESNGVAGSLMEEENGTSGETKKKSKKSKLKRQNNSFRRVKEEDVEIKKEELANNTFEAKGGADQYGFKANQILKHTKGKSFRHEKTKKKRGTYKGGAINMGVTSIKFDSD